MVISHCAANEVLGQRSVLRDFPGLCKAIRIERVQLVAREQLFDRPFVGAVLVTFHKVIGATAMLMNFDMANDDAENV
ncbi:hypothetical protein, partial [Anaerotruncus colihominis]|uniref:hypothetical protein n=1 Tax=Anaerotruncus colihominis TaxID=169435 RepID=UPI00210E60B8